MSRLTYRARSYAVTCPLPITPVFLGVVGTAIAKSTGSHLTLSRAATTNCMVCRPGLCSCAHRYRPMKDLLVPARTIRTDTSEKRREVLAERDVLFTFLPHPGTDATNWRAEQAV